MEKKLRLFFGNDVTIVAAFLIVQSLIITMRAITYSFKQSLSLTFIALIKKLSSTIIDLQLGKPSVEANLG